MKSRAVLLCLVVAGCVPHGVPVVAPHVERGGGGADIDALVVDFYGAGLLPAEASKRAADVLRRHPSSAVAHEVAALAAELRGDADEVFAQWLGALADLDADASEAYAFLIEPHTAGELAAVGRVLDELRLRSPRPAVRALATHELAYVREKQGHLDEARALIALLHPVTAWQVLGALDNDQGKGFYAELPPEEQPGPAIAHTRAIAGPLVPLHWRRVEQTTVLGAVPLDELLFPHEQALAWLATWVRSDQARTVQLRLSSTSPARVFVNDKSVAAEERISEGGFDDVVAPVALHAGWNQVLVQSAHRRGTWSIEARFSDDQGAPLELATSPTPQSYMTANDDELVAPQPLPVIGPDGRRQLIGAVRLLRLGRTQAAQTELQPFVEEHPDNALAMFWGAYAYAQNEELGKAIDLLDRGVERFGKNAAEFYAARGVYYSQKALWEHAQSDLQAAIDATPHRSTAEQALVQLLEKRNWDADRCQLLQKIVARAPDDAWAQREHGRCLGELGYNDGEERSLTLATRVLPGERRGWEWRLNQALRIGKLSRARRLIAQLERIDPTNPAWYVRQGDVRRRAGDFVGARASYDVATRIAPESPYAWKRLGELAYEHGDRKEALTAWKRARELEPDDSALAQHVEYLEPLRLGYVDAIVPGDVEIDRAVHAAITPFPHSQVAMLLDHEVTEVNADGSTRRVVTNIEQAIDDKGRDQMTLVHVPRVGAVKILRAYALNDKGERQEASSIRNGEVRFRNLQVGAKTVLQYVHYAPAPNFLPGAFVADWYFQAPGRQHEDATWVLVLPRGKTLHVQLTGQIAQSRKLDGERELYTFHASHMRPIPIEQMMAPIADLAANVAVSTVSSWDDYVHWERGLLSDAFRTNPSLDALVDKLAKEGKSPREKLDRLFHYVAQEIRYQQDYETTIAGVRPHAAPSVVERGYGDCKDKAVLLVEMARRLGIKVSFALLRTTPHGQVARDVPNQQFDHAIAYVPAQPGIAQPVFLDPTSDGLDVGNLRSDDQGALSLVMDPLSRAWSLVPIPYEAPELAYDHHEIKIDVKSETEALLADDMTLRGMPAMGLRHALRNEGQATQVYAAIAQLLFTGGTVKDAKRGNTEDTWHPLKLHLDVDVSQSLRAGDEHTRLVLPGRFILASVITQKTRETPMHLGPPDSSVYDIVTTLPVGTSIVHTPKDFTVEHACFAVSRKAKVEGNKVTLHLGLVRHCTDLAVADYEGFRTAVQKVVRNLDDDLLFAPAKSTGNKPSHASR